MADTKITGLTAIDAPVAADVLPVVDDVAGTPITKKMTITQLITLLGASFQGLDADLTAIAALSTTAYGRAFLALADEAALNALVAASASAQTTPTVTAGTGTITTVACTLNKKTVGKLVHVRGLITITTNGTGATRLIVPLGFTPAANSIPISGVRTADEKSVVGYTNSTNLLLTLHDGSYPGSDGAVIGFNGVIESQ